MLIPVCISIGLTLALIACLARWVWQEWQKEVHDAGN